MINLRPLLVVVMGHLRNNGQKSASSSDLPYISYPFIIEIYLNKKMKLYF